MRCNVKEDLRNKRGFVWKDQWYPNGGGGHEKNAMDIIRNHRRSCPSEDWDWNEGSAQDYMVLKKRAIQIGNGTRAMCIIVAGRYYSSGQMEKFKYKYNLEGYDVIFIW